MVNSLGILSAYSVYAGQQTFIRGADRTSDVQNYQNSLDFDSLDEQDDIEDTATISDEAQKLYGREKNAQDDMLPAEKRAANKDGKSVEDEKTSVQKKAELSKDKDNADKAKSKSDSDLTADEQQQVQQLKARDAEVRAHEQAHISAAAGLRTSAPSYDYETGPDGKKYAVGGEVSISFSSTGDPEKDMQLAETMRNAALAPAEPSGQDRSVAQSAEKIIQESKMKLTEQQPQQNDVIANASTAKTLVGAGTPDGK